MDLQEARNLILAALQQILNAGYRLYDVNESDDIGEWCYAVGPIDDNRSAVSAPIYCHEIGF